MKSRRTSRFLSIVLLVAMVLTLLPATAFAEDSANTTWTSIALDEITPEDTIAITMKVGDEYYALPTNGAGSNNQPLVAKADSVEGTTLSTTQGSSKLGWTFTAVEGRYQIANADGDLLYVTATNNGVRIGTPQTGNEAGALWNPDSSGAYLTATDSNNATRYLGVYQTRDFRCYTSINSNIAGQAVGFWKLESDGSGTIEPTISPISDALAASSGEFMVKGVVTLVDGKNVYIQDETGGICLFFAEAPTDIALGDTLIGTGNKITYKGLPELQGASYTKSDDVMELTAKTTTIGALTTADICTYVKLENLTITAVSGTNIDVTDASGETIQIYNAVIGDAAYAVNDVINFTGAVGCYNNMQLRNTLASEIELAETPADKPAAPTADVQSGPVEAGTVVTFSTTTEGAVISYSTDNGETWTEGNTYTVNESVTIQVKAVKDDVSSSISSFTYTIAGEEPTISTIADALAANSGEFTVKGVVTLVDGKNIYVQDATGAIDLYFTAAPTDIELGDTLIGTGTRADYKGLPELKNASYTKSEGLTLTAKTTTIGALATADICAYVYLENLTITAINGTNIDVADENGGSIQIFKAVTGDTTYAVGDVINFTGAVSCFTSLQLRNTLASEIVATGVHVDRPAAPTADVAEGTVEAGTIVTFSTTTEEAVISYSTDNGANWTEGNTYTVNETVTVQVKATKGVLSSEIVSFTYTVPTEEPPVTVTLDKFTAAPAEGDQIVIFYPKDNLAMTATANGAKLTGTAATPEEDKLILTEEMALLTVSVTDGVYTFVGSDGKFLTCPATGNGLSFAEAESDYSKWTLEQQEDGKWIVTNLNAEFTKNGVTYKQCLEYYSGFTTYNADTSDAFKFDFYGIQKPEEKVGLVTDLADLTDGSYVVIYNPGNSKAMSSEVILNDYYLAAVDAEVAEDRIVEPAAEIVWKVSVSDEGVYTFTQGDKAVTGWLNDKFQELTSNASHDGAATGWKLETLNADTHTFYLYNATLSSFYIEVYNKTVNNVSTLAFCGYKKGTNEKAYGMRFYLVEEPTPQPSDGLPAAGDEVLIYNAAAEGVMGIDSTGLNASLGKIPAVIEDGKAIPENGAYVYTVGKDGDYYTFASGGKYLATCDKEQLFMADTLADTGENCGYWTLESSGDGYLIKSKTARYNNSGVVCIEFFSGAFSGWTYKSAEADIFRFSFYPLGEGLNTMDGVVNNPKIVFVSTSSPVKQMPYKVNFTIDDLTPLENLTVTASLNGEPVTNLESDDKSFHFEVPAEVTAVESSLNVAVTVNNADGSSYSNECSFPVQDIPAFTELQPEPGSATGDDFMPLIRARVLNVSDSDQALLILDGETYPMQIQNGMVSFQPTEPLKEGRTTVRIQVMRADGVSGEISWSFVVGELREQLYFGQLHSHTAEYSDGAGTLAGALEYIAAIPDSDNVQFVAFTDHSNYFDKSSANPEAALYDTAQMTQESKDKWETYKSTIETFNESQSDLIAIPGFEMTWSGGPGHINTFNTPGIVSRNNSTLNNKNNDAGMKAYYALLDNAALVDSISQFNHPGKTFGNFSDFSYWDAVTDNRIYTVEVGNGEGQIGAGGYYPSYEQYILALDKGWHVAPTNNQDNHKGRWGNANTARDVILTDDYSEQGLYEAIRNYRVYATEDKNLEIYYTVNDEQLGTIFKEIPETLEFNVQVSDPDASDSISKVELVVNSGKVAYTWDDPTEIATGLLEATLEPAYTYYFVRVTEGDGDLAVTAPVWVGESLKLGISAVECGTANPVTGEEFTLTTTFFNSEASEATIKSIVYTVNGGQVLHTDTEAGKIDASSSKTVEFKYTPTKAKIMTITVTAVIELNGEDYTFSKDIELEVQDADALVYIGIDASHYNEYVAGNYNNSMGNFGALAGGYGVRTVELKTSEELIDACANEKYMALIFTAPSRRLADAQSNPRTYSEDELAAIAAFNANGGQVIVCGWGDAYENYSVITGNTEIKHMAATQNDLLEALGSSVRLGDDEVVDGTLNGGQEQRLYLSTYNFDSFLLEGVEYDAEHPNDNLYTERYSNYGGCSVFFTDETAIPATVTPVVFGHATTNIDNKDNDSNPQGVKYPYADGDNRVVVMATEQLDGQGLIIVSGAAFMSNFEVQATVSDNGAEKNYSNYKICENLVKGFNEITITPIATVQAQTEAGLVYTIEGVVTSNASGYDKDTAFFDCIYVQDETAGICCFPVAGNYQIGDVVRIKGSTGWYQAEMELKVRSIEKIGHGDPVEPTEVTAAQINEQSLLGSLVTLRGTVESFEYENGLIQTILVKDANGDVARVFIDGYITTSEDVKDLAVGAWIEATGLSSYDDTWKDENYYPRIRVRNRADVVVKPAVLADTPVRLVAQSMSLKGKAELNFYLDLPETLLGDENAYVTINGEKTLVKNAVVKTFDEGTYYRFSAYALFVQLNEEYTLRVFDGQGNPVALVDDEDNDATSNGVVYSPRTYIDTILSGDYTEKEKALVSTLSDVGSLAQEYFKYSTDTRVELKGDPSVVTADTVKDYEGTLEFNKDSGFAYAGSSVVLRENTSIRHYFSASESSLTKYKFLVGETELSPKQRGNYYYLEISDIPGAKLGTPYVVKAVNKNDASDVAFTIEYSAMSYVYDLLSVDNQEARDLMKALVLYYQAADAYFNNPAAGN